LAVTGGLLALWVTGQTLNVFSQIGMVLLIGLMAKNGILVVEFANQLRDRGMSVRDAVLEASVVRLRPILMTSIATVLGAVPLAMATGAGAESRQALGVICCSPPIPSQSAPSRPSWPICNQSPLRATAIRRRNNAAIAAQGDFTPRIYRLASP
jgi:hypothetical protein